MSWFESARDHIAAIHRTLPADATFEQRVKALRDGYPWGERAHHPYKAWLKAQRQYLASYQPPTVDTKRFPLSPLERLMKRDQGHDGTPQ